MRLRVLPVLGAAVIAGLLAAQPAVAALAPVKFHADSGDRCRRGVTEGTLERVRGPVVRPVVQVRGTLSDDLPTSVCAPDRMHSWATFAAYNGRTLVDSETVRADDATVRVSLDLSDRAGVTAIDRVVVRVCRFTDTPIGISYCGSAAEYPMP